MKTVEFWFFIQIQLLANALFFIIGTATNKKLKVMSKINFKNGAYYIFTNTILFVFLYLIFWINRTVCHRIYSNPNTPYYLILILLIAILFVFYLINTKQTFGDVFKKEKSNTETTLFSGQSLIYTALFLLTMGIICVFPYLFTSQKWLVAYCKDTGTIGDTIGGIMGPFVAIVAAFLTFIAFWVQYKANLKQNEQYNKQANDIAIERFENRFFKFIDYHRENVAQLKFRDSKTVETKYWEGNQVFTIIHYQVRDLINEYIKEKKINTKDLSPKEKYKIVNFIYQCVFFGAGEDGRKILEKIFADSKEDFDHISFLKKKAAYQTINNKINKYYSGYVRGLGHYFRNIYQAIQYVEEQRDELLDANKKYQYIAHFRAQMSVYEQIVFFYNSLSDLGANWEWKQYEKKYPVDWGIKVKSFNKLFITKYDLIRNTLYNDVGGEIVDGISIKDFYPLINLEHEEECSIYGVLPYDYDGKGEKKICRFCFNEKYVGYVNEDIREKIIDCFTNEKFLDDKKNDKEFICQEAECKSTEIIKELKIKYGIL